jgi:hypothetical protein
VQNLKGSEETPEDPIKETGQVNEMNLSVSNEDYVLQLLQPQNSIKSTQADSHIKM